MNVFGQDVRVPLVTEKSAINAALPGPAGTVTTVISGASSIHAAYIDVFVVSTVRINSIDMLLYGASGKVRVPINLHTGNIAAGTAVQHRYGGSLQSAAIAAPTPAIGEGIGQYYDITVTNNDAGGLDGLVTVWTAARM